MEIKVPQLGESVTEATVARWFKKVGDTVAQDEPLVELETDKVTIEVPAGQSGTLSEISAQEGDEVSVGAVLGTLGEGGADTGSDDKDPEPEPEKKEEAAEDSDKDDEKAEEKPADEGAAGDSDIPMSPAVRKLVADENLDPSRIKATGKDGRLTKANVLDFLKAREEGGDEEKSEETADLPENNETEASAGTDRSEERVRMTRLRKRIAERLKEAQNTAAMLSTFNEADMSAVMEAREKYRERFEKKHGVRLGFMSFFAKACIAALNEVPAVNAMIDGDEIVYRSYVDLGIAVGTEQGLVVPVLRDADQKSFADIEKEIGDLGRRARAGELSMDDLTGGSFTITNGGVYGSLLSTPILNPPQSGILGMHKIEKRAVVVDDEVVVRPMMYLALSYDHRIIDGSEAVTFLVRVKECIEEPERILFEI